MVRSGQTVPIVPLPYRLDTLVSMDLGHMGQLGQGYRKEEKNENRAISLRMSVLFDRPNRPNRTRTTHNG